MTAIKMTGDTTGIARPSTPTNSDHSSLHGVVAPNNTQAAYRRANNERRDQAMSRNKLFEAPDSSFRAFFRERWSRFLRAHYRSPEEVAVSFNVRFQTAFNWWEGDHAPSGYAVAHAFRSYPEGAHEYLSGAPSE